MRSKPIGGTFESMVNGIHGAATRAASLAAIVAATLLVPGTTWGQEESMPTAGDGERVIAARIAGVPLVPSFPSVQPDYRECVRLDSFVSNGTESLESWGLSHYLMKFQVTVSYLDDCVWSLSYLEHFDPRAISRAGVKAEKAAAADIDVTSLLQGTGVEDLLEQRAEQVPFGYHEAEDGTQAVLSGEIVFQQVEVRILEQKYRHSDRKVSRF